MAKETKNLTKTNERRQAAANLIAKTNRENPAPEDLERLRREFDQVPEIYRRIGNSANLITDKVLDNLSGKSVFLRAATERYMSEMKSELGFDSSTLVEKMLINKILIRWLRLQAMENDHLLTTYQAHSIPLGMYHDKRLHLAQKRYLAAIETLAKVRRMIAQTQVKGAKMFKNLVDGREKSTEQ